MVVKSFKLILIFAIAVLILSSFFSSVYSKNKSISKSFWHTKANGISFARVKLSQGDSDEFISFIRIDPNVYKAKILSAKSFGSKSLTIREIAEKSGADAVINASYFDEHEEPLGYLKIDGKVYNDYIAEPIIYSGVIAIKNGKMNILHRSKFKSENYKEALQAGPRLISAGRETQGIKNTIDYREKSRRAGIAVDKKGNIILFKTSRAIANWGQIIMTITSNPSLNIVEAMNLDGGSSTQIYVKSGSYEFNEGNAYVPVAIGFYKD